MSAGKAELIRDALTLPAAARAELADSLLESLDDVTGDHTQEAWRDEIRLRAQQIDNGSVRLIPWGDARRTLRARLSR